MYAQVTNDEITTISGRLPNAARRLDSRAWVLGFPQAPVELQEACGWLPVTDMPRPADTDTHTTDRSVELVDGRPQVMWTSRPWTADELSARTASFNDTTIRQQAAAALDTNRTFIDLASPTNAQTLAQVKVLSRQMNGLIRLQLGLLDAAD